MSVTRRNVEFAKRIGLDRVGNDYVYGGNWNPFDTNVGTDCSGCVIDICDAVRNGTAMAWTRHGMSTETWRPVEVGQTGTIFNTVCVAHPRDFPPDAVVKIAIHHGPGGGANSHMWCEVDGVRLESNGSDGCVTGADARDVYDTSYANDWHYIPGGIVEDGTAPTAPTPIPAKVRTFGPDISNNNGTVDIAQVQREGFDFVIAKVSEGASFKDIFWSHTRDECKRLGLIVVGYHYIKTDNVEAQADNFVSVLGDKSIPAMLDFEANSGGIDNYWAVKRAVEARGVKVRLSYIPDWYWERIGRPDLSQVPGLVRSEYVPGTGYASVLYPGDTSALWGSYGGRAPDILQFTETALIAGKTLDANAFRGTPDQLRALLGLTTGDDMAQVPQEQWNRAMVLLENIAGVRRPSKSGFRWPGEGEVNTCAGFSWTADGNEHMDLTIKLADYGDPESLALLMAVSQDTDPDRARDATLAKLVLGKIKPTQAEKTAATAHVQSWLDAEAAHKGGA